MVGLDTCFRARYATLINVEYNLANGFHNVIALRKKE